MSFAEITDRNAAEAARGVLLHATVAADETPDDPDEYYDHQLVGLAAYDLEGAPSARSRRWCTAVPRTCWSCARRTAARRWCRSSGRWSPRSTSPAAGSWSPTGPGLVDPAAEDD